MHLITIGEGYPDGLKKFEEHFHGKHYTDKNGKLGRLRVREMKIYNLTYNENVEQEVFADIKDWTRGTSIEGNKVITTFKKIINSFIKFTNIINVDNKIDSVKSSGLKWKILKEKNESLSMWLIPIGAIEDRKENGVEQV